MNDSISILVESLILTGGVIMFLAILSTRNILREVKEPKYHKIWRVLLGLMVLFLLGYLAAVYIVAFGNAKAIFIITGVIFFLGAIFVNIVVRTGYHTIQNLGTTINALEKALLRQQKTEESLQIKAAQERQQSQALLFLAKNLNRGNGDPRHVFELVTEKTAETLNVERVSIWLYEEHQSSISTIDLYEKSKKKHSKGDVLYSKDYPAYFRALEEGLVIDANNANKDPRTAEYSESYLTPLGITSMLDAPIRVEGKMRGVLCLEHIGTMRNWTTTEQSFANSISDMVSMIMETSERRRTEKELEISLSVLRAALESTADGILIVDNNGKINGLNQQFVKMWGIPNKILETKDDNQVFDFTLSQLKNPEKFLPSFKELHKNPKLENFDLLEFKDGKTFERFSKPQQLKNGEIIGHVWSFRDITERKRAQAEILKLNEQLEQRVQKRTEEVVDLNKSLKKHISDLETANKELDSFSYSVSHDLRSPLRTINGFTKLIERKYKDKIDEQGKEFMKIISDSTQKLEQLIDDLLSFSRLGKKELVKAEIDMNELVNSIVKDIDISQWNSKAKITVKEMLPSFGDKALLSQVFVNMLSNALKYSKNKDIPVIEIGSYRKENENIYYIKDNGVGFNMAQYDKLFKVFQRLHSDAEFQGSGVGLAIVDRIIKRHEGRVWAEGKVNEGATFYFALPIHPVNMQ